MNQDFRYFWAGQTVSGFGSALTMVAVPLVAVQRLDASAFQVGMLTAAVVAPTLLFGIAIAAWGDGLRYKRPFLIWADVVAAFGSLALAGLLLAGRLDILVMVAAVFLLGLVRTFIETVYFVHLRGLVGDHQLVRARAHLEAGEHAGGVVGRAAAGPLVSWLSAAAPFIVDAVSYLFNALCLRRLRTPETPVEPPTPAAQVSLARRMGQGITEIKRQPFLRGLVPYVVASQLAVGAVTAMTAPFLLRTLGIPVALYGLLFVFIGIAGTIGAVLSSSLAKRDVDPRAMVLWGFGLAALPVVALAAAGGPLPLAAVMAAAGIGLPGLFSAIANVGLTGYVTRAVPQEVLGRAAMSLQVVNTLPLIIGALAGGMLGDLIGIRPALSMVAVLAVLAVVLLVPLARLMRDTPSGAGDPNQPGPGADDAGPGGEADGPAADPEDQTTVPDRIPTPVGG